MHMVLVRNSIAFFIWADVSFLHLFIYFSSFLFHQPCPCAWSVLTNVFEPLLTASTCQECDLQTSIMKHLIGNWKRCHGNTFVKSAFSLEYIMVRVYTYSGLASNFTWIVRYTNTTRSILNLDKCYFFSCTYVRQAHTPTPSSPNCINL
jgi:hypothetical protein